MITAEPKAELEDFYMTPSEVAQMLRKSPETLANERSKGEGLPFVKQGGKVLYRSSDIMAMLNANLAGFSWARLEQSLARYGMPAGDVTALVGHLKRDM